MTGDLLLAAVDTSRRWYDLVFALHGIPWRADDRLWVSMGEPPPWHSAVKTLSPEVDADSVLAAMAGHPRGSIADSFGVLDLSAHGFDLLIDSTWVHHRDGVPSEPKASVVVKLTPRARRYAGLDIKPSMNATRRRSV